jgi:hypothetical protein
MAALMAAIFLCYQLSFFMAASLRRTLVHYIFDVRNFKRQ